MRNGYFQEGTIQAGWGTLPRHGTLVRGRERAIRFSSQIIPFYLRRTKSLAGPLQWLYPQGYPTRRSPATEGVLVGRPPPVGNTKPAEYLRVHLRRRNPSQCPEGQIPSLCAGRDRGGRESEEPWKEFLLDLKYRGLSVDPKLAIGDGA